MEVVRDCSSERLVWKCLLLYKPRRGVRRTVTGITRARGYPSKRVWISFKRHVWKWPPVGPCRFFEDVEHFSSGFGFPREIRKFLACNWGGGRRYALHVIGPRARFSQTPRGSCGSGRQRGPAAGRLSSGSVCPSPCETSRRNSVAETQSYIVKLFII